jgi:hypothetical protein
MSDKAETAASNWRERISRGEWDDSEGRIRVSMWEFEISTYLPLSRSSGQ